MLKMIENEIPEMFVKLIRKHSEHYENKQLDVVKETELYDNSHQKNLFKFSMK